MKNAMIDLNILPLETLAEMANEAGEQAENNAKITVQKAIDAGRYLTAAKDQIEHGQWLAWLGKNWNYSQPTASRYMTLASKLFTMNNLAQPKYVNEGLRMIAAEKAESEPETAPRSERKPADVVVSIPDDSREFQDEPDIDVPFSPPDDDPTPDPPTQRKTAAGSEKVSEGKKPKTAAIVPEILPDGPEAPPQKHWPEVSLEDLVEGVIKKLEHEKQRKAAAKTLRKLADKLDPPTKFVKPTIEDVKEYCERRKNGIDPELFLAHYNTNGWKLSNGNKMADWQSAVITWESRDKSNGNGGRNGSAHRGTGKRGYTADEVFS